MPIPNLLKNKRRAEEFAYAKDGEEEQDVMLIDGMENGAKQAWYLQII